MDCYNGGDRVYYSVKEIMSDASLSDDEREEIMTKSKTSVQIDAIHKKTVWIRSNSDNDNRYRGGSSSKNTNSGNYNSK